MEDRLLKFLDTEQLSSSKFADVIGVQRSSVSHILSGRNKPSFDFLQKTLKAFPMLNADWLILGEGKMYESGDLQGGGSLFNQPDPIPKETSIVESNESNIAPEIASSELNISKIIEDIPEERLSDGNEIVKSKDKTIKTSRTLSKVILLYNDNSFDSYNPDE
jgi:transcriptional regulator with XRE-family HTH domain